MTTFQSYAGELLERTQEYHRLGLDQGKKGLPPPHATAPDAHEELLQTQGQKHLGDEQGLFDLQLVEATRALANAEQKVRSYENDCSLLLHAEAAANSVNAELAGDRSALVLACEQRLRKQQEIKHFQAINGITSAAKYPESIWWHIGIVVACWAGEVGMNAYFYENNSGLMGGIAVAALVAVLNMGAAFGFGFGFRFHNLKDPIKKAGGWACLVFFVIITLFCNALFAAFRSEYQLVMDPSDPTQLTAAFSSAWPEAAKIFVLNMQFKDLDSFVLFGIGLLLSVLAFRKGYTLDDRYPGYGDLDREYKKAQMQEEKFAQAARQKAKELLHQRRLALQAAMDEPNNQVAMLARRASDMQTQITMLQMQTARIGRDYATVIKTYRSANRAVCALDEPEYFKTEPVLVMKTSAEAAAPILHQITATQHHLQEIASKLRPNLQSKLNDLNSAANIILNEEMERFMTSINRDAQALIAPIGTVRPSVQSTVQPT